MITFLTKFKSYLYGVVLAAFIGLSVYSYFLHKEVDTLTISKAKIEQIAEQQKGDLKICSDNTIALKTREDQLTKNAEAAVAVVKVSAAKDRKVASDILFKKPVVPNITEYSVLDLGGTDDMIARKDYLATHELFNELIDLRGVK